MRLSEHILLRWVAPFSTSIIADFYIIFEQSARDLTISTPTSLLSEPCRSPLTRHLGRSHHDVELMAGMEALKRMPKFKRCKITSHQLNVLMHNFGAPPPACRAAPK